MQEIEDRWRSWIGGGFAHMRALFAVHPRDRERAIAYLEKANAEGLGWADIRQQLLEYMKAERFPAEEIDRNLNRADTLHSEQFAN